MDLNNLSKDQLLALIHSQGIKFDIDTYSINDEIKHIMNSSVEYNYGTESYGYIGVNWKKIDAILIAMEKKIIVLYDKKNGGMTYTFKSIHYENYGEYTFETIVKFNKAYRYFLSFVGGIEFPEVITDNIIVIGDEFENFVCMFELMNI